MSYRGPQNSVASEKVKDKGSRHSTAERKVPGLIPVLGSPPGGDVSHKPGGRLPLASRVDWNIRGHPARSPRIGRDVGEL